MRVIMTALCSVFLALPSAARAQAADAEGTIKALTDAFEAAWNGGNASTLAAQYAKGARILPPGSEPVQGASAILALWKSELESGLRLALTTKEVHPFGDAAVEVGGYVFTQADGAHADHGKYMVLWKKDGASWKIYRDIWNSSMTP